MTRTGNITIGPQRWIGHVAVIAFKAIVTGGNGIGQFLLRRNHVAGINPVVKPHLVRRTFLDFFQRRAVGVRENNRCRRTVFKVVVANRTLAIRVKSIGHAIVIVVDTVAV